MSEKVTESQIYLFLADYGNNWKTDADKLDKEDGKVSKYEFKKFLANEMNGWQGVDISKLSHSIIDNFFRNIDQNDVGSNFNILDQTELTNMESSISAYETLNEFLKDKCNTDFVNTGLNNKYMNSWKWDISDGLTDALNKCIKDGITDKNKINDALAEPYKQAFATATANCYVAQYTDPQNGEFKSLLNGLNYSFESDSMFQKIIAECVGSIGAVEPGKDGAQQIADKIKSLVEDYMAAASLQSGGNAKNLKQYESYNDNQLNDLQKARLGQMAASALEGKLSTIDIKDRSGNKIDLTQAGYTEIFKKAAAEFVEWYTTSGYKTISAGPNQGVFAAIEADLTNNAQTLFEKSSAYSNFQKEVQMVAGYILINENSAIYTKLKEAGLNNDQLAKVKEQNLPEYLDAYNEALKEVLAGNSDYVKDGKIDFDAVDAKILEIVKVKLGLTVSEPEAPADTKDTDKTTYVKAADTINNFIDRMLIDDLGGLNQGYSQIHTEFGVNQSGDIVFENNDTTKIWNNLVKTVTSKIKSTAEGKEAIEKLGGDTILKRLIQAAWIMTYTSMNSSQENNTTAFIQTTLDNLKKIMTSLKTNPKYLAIYTQHTAYANKNLTSGLVHYGTATTFGNDQIINYKYGTKEDTDGTVHLVNTTDDPDYQATMKQLLSRLKENYKQIDESIITSVFRMAQKQAIDACCSNKFDCPHGCGNNGHYVEDTTFDWGGKNNRKGDDNEIFMKELVQMTLYYFDKLLYTELSK